MWTPIAIWDFSKNIWIYIVHSLAIYCQKWSKDLGIFHHGNRNFANRHSKLGINFQMYQRLFPVTKRSGIYGWLVSSPLSPNLSAWLKSQGWGASRLKDFATAQTDTFLTLEGSRFWSSGTLRVGSVKCGFLIRRRRSRERSLGFRYLTYLPNHMCQGGLQTTFCLAHNGLSINVSGMKESLHNSAASFHREKVGEIV